MVLRVAAPTTSADSTRSSLLNPSSAQLCTQTVSFTPDLTALFNTSFKHGIPLSLTLSASAFLSIVQPLIMKYTDASIPMATAVIAKINGAYVRSIVSTLLV